MDTIRKNTSAQRAPTQGTKTIIINPANKAIAISAASTYSGRLRNWFVRTDSINWAWTSTPGINRSVGTVLISNRPVAEVPSSANLPCIFFGSTDRERLPFLSNAARTSLAETYFETLCYIIVIHVLVNMTIFIHVLVNI